MKILNRGDKVPILQFKSPDGSPILFNPEKENRLKLLIFLRHLA